GAGGARRRPKSPRRRPTGPRRRRRRLPRRRFDVSLVTPEGPAFEGEAEMIVVPGAAGEIGVLARHAPLVATLKAGSTRVHTGEEVREYANRPGICKCELDR